MRSDLADISGIILPWFSGKDAIMRRDMSLIRELLLEIETGGGARDFAAWSDDAVRYHLALMLDGGLLTGKKDGARVVVEGITWAGHDFLGAIRADAVWRKVLSKFTEAGGGLAFETIKQLALSFLS